MSPVISSASPDFKRGSSQVKKIYQGSTELWSSSALPAIGDPLGGGFYGGLISHTQNGTATHVLIISPRSSGSSGAGYPVTTSLQYKTSNTTVGTAESEFDGRLNTNQLITSGISQYPAAQFCVNLSIGGFTDWYLPARYELEILYTNLKPSTAANSTGAGTTSAVNPYAVPPRSIQYTSGNPAQTSVAAFQLGGAECFQASGHWTSTSISGLNRARTGRFDDGTSQISETNSIAQYATRAIRRIPIGDL